MSSLIVPDDRDIFIELGDPLLDNFRNWQTLCLRSMLNVDPTEIQYDMGDWIAYGPRERLAIGFRGLSKSWQTAFYATWRIKRNAVLRNGHPDINIIVVSGTFDRAQNFSTFTRELFYRIPELHDLVQTDRNKKWAGTTFDVEGAEPSQVATCSARAIFGRMTGDRADVIIGDDIELPENSETSGQREKVRKRVDDFTNILKPDTGEIVLLGTSHAEESLYNHLIEGEYAFARRMWPGRYPLSMKIPDYKGDLAPMIEEPLQADPSLEWAPTEPSRFSEEILQAKEAKSSSMFAMQFMLDTTLADETRYPLKLRDLIVMDLPVDVGPEHPIWANSPECVISDLEPVGFTGDKYHRPSGFLGGRDGQTSYSPYDSIAMHVDPSGRGEDETSWCISAVIGGFIYLLHVDADVLGYEDSVLEKMLVACKRYNCKWVLYEPTGAGTMFGNVLSGYFNRFHYFASIEATSPGTGFKEKKIIDSLEPVMNQHRLVVNTEVIRQDAPREGKLGTRYKLFHQMTRIERKRGALAKDDRVDVVAAAVKHWADRMQINQEEHVAQMRSDEDSAAIDDFWRMVDKQNSASGILARHPATAAHNRGRRIWGL